MNKKENTGKENGKNEKKDFRRIMRLEARVTKEEYAQAAELAKTCGLSLSCYVRRTALGQHPRQRLSEREMEALCSLADARGGPYPHRSSRQVHTGGQAGDVFQ